MTTAEPQTAKGWGIAAGVVLLAIICAGTAYWIHVKTFCSPLDTTCPAAVHATASEPSAEHPH